MAKPKEELPRYTLRVPKDLLDKIGYIAEYYGRTKNKELEQIIRNRIRTFEKKFGEIKLEKEDKEN